MSAPRYPATEEWIEAMSQAFLVRGKLRSVAELLKNPKARQVLGEDREDWVEVCGLIGDIQGLLALASRETQHLRE
jgi:hypothetical protein